MKMLGLWILLRWDLELYRGSEHFGNSYSCLRQTRKSPYLLPTLSWTLYMALAHSTHPWERWTPSQQPQPITAHGISQTLLPPILSYPCSHHPGSVTHPPPTWCLWETLLAVTVSLEKISGWTWVLCQTWFEFALGLHNGHYRVIGTRLTQHPPWLYIPACPCPSLPRKGDHSPNHTPNIKILGDLPLLYHPTSETTPALL